MRRLSFFLFLPFLAVGLLAACAPPHLAPSAQPTNGAVGLPNPASKFCVDQGYKLEMRKDDQGNEYGVCIFDDGNECEEWAFFRGECGAGRAKNLSLNVVEAAGLADTTQIDVLAPKTSSVDPDASREPRQPGMEVILSITDPADIEALVSPLDASLALVPPLRCPASYELQFQLKSGDVQTFNLGLCGLYGPQKYWRGLTIHPPETFVSKFNDLLKMAGAPQR